MSITFNVLLGYRIVRRFFSTSNKLRNYYQILNLPRNCTNRQIKDSFIKLSKENHPDINKNKDAHKKFLEISEAYKVLSKPESRRLYDLGFSRTNLYTNSSRVHVHYREEFGRDPWMDPSFYRNRDKSQDAYYESKGYYGIKGIKKVSNLTVALICLSITMVVLGLQILAIRYSFTFRRNELIRRSNEAEESLRQVREAAERNGNELQLELLKLRLGASSKNE